MKSFTSWYIFSHSTSCGILAKCYLKISSSSNGS